MWAKFILLHILIREHNNLTHGTFKCFWVLFGQFHLQCSEMTKPECNISNLERNKLQQETIIISSCNNVIFWYFIPTRYLHCMYRYVTANLHLLTISNCTLYIKTMQVFCWTMWTYAGFRFIRILTQMFHLNYIPCVTVTQPQ